MGGKIIMKRVLITGGSGYIGRHLIQELLDRYEGIEILSMSRGEAEISQLLNACSQKDKSYRLKIVMSDVRDKDAVHFYSRNVDTVIHLAALKRVDLCESECTEAVTINILGTMNLLNSFHGDTFIQMSTDKAVEPANCYGASKMIAEKLIFERACKREANQRFMIVRSGNVLSSTGSVIDIWHHQIKEYNEITVTHPDMMRFITSVEGVVRLFIAILEKGENGKIYFTHRGESVVIGEMAAKFIKEYGNANTRIKYIGLRPGERMIEKMRSLGEANTVAGFEEMVDLKKTPVDIN